MLASFITRYATPKIISAVSAVLIASIVAGFIYLKGHTAAEHKYEVERLEYTIETMQHVIDEQQRRLTAYAIVSDENQIAHEQDKKRLAELEEEKADVITSVPVNSGGIGRDATDRLRKFWRDSDPDSN